MSQEILTMQLGVYRCGHEDCFDENDEASRPWEAEIPPLATGLEMQPTCGNCGRPAFLVEVVTREQV